jgi:hypothetical protein
MWSDILEVVELENLKGRVWSDAEGVLLENSYPLTNLIDCDICLTIWQSAVRSRDDGRAYVHAGIRKLLY